MIDNNAIAEGIEKVTADWAEKLVQINGELAHSKTSPDRWSISEVIGHLVDSACNNHQRFVRAQSVDELVFPKYEQNEWVAAADYRNFEWTELVSLWHGYNKMLAVLIRNMPDSAMKTRCTITPYETCDLGFLVKDYLDHLIHHLNILEERIG